MSKQKTSDSIGPWFKIWADRYLSDFNLRACSPGARALYIDLQCLMHRSEKYGYLIQNDGNCSSKSPSKVVYKSDKWIRNALRYSAKQFAKWLPQLIDAGKVKRDEDGNLYCPELLRDKEFIDKCRAAGKKAYQEIDGPIPPGAPPRGTPQGTPPGVPPRETPTTSPGARRRRNEDIDKDKIKNRNEYLDTNSSDKSNSFSVLSKTSSRDFQKAMQPGGSAADIHALDAIYEILQGGYYFNEPDIRSLKSQVEHAKCYPDDIRRAFDEFEDAMRSDKPPDKPAAFFNSLIQKYKQEHALATRES